MVRGLSTRRRGVASALAWTDLGGAVLLHSAAGPDPQVLERCEDLAARHEPTLVFLDLPPAVGVRDRDAVAASLTGRPGELWLVPVGADRSEAAGLAEWLSHLLGRAVVAPDGEAVEVAEGWFVPATAGAGWTRYAPGRVPVAHSRRLPTPVWESRSFAEPRDLGGGVRVEPLPAGAWITGPGAPQAADSLRKWLTGGLQMDPGHPRVVVGHPGPASVPLAAVQAFWEQLDDRTRPLVRFAEFGATDVAVPAPVLTAEAPDPADSPDSDDPTAGSFGQALADLLATPVVAATGVPVLAPWGSGRSRVRVLLPNGAMHWRPYVWDLRYLPRAERSKAEDPQPVGYRAPIEGLPEVASGVYEYAPDAVLEVTRSGLWMRPPEQPHDASAVRSAPIEPGRSRVFHAAGGPAGVAERMRRLAAEALPRLEAEVWKLAEVLPSTAAITLIRAAAADPAAVRAVAAWETEAEIETTVAEIAAGENAAGEDEEAAEQVMAVAAFATVAAEGTLDEQTEARAAVGELVVGEEIAESIATRAVVGELIAGEGIAESIATRAVVGELVVGEGIAESAATRAAVGELVVGEGVAESAATTAVVGEPIVAEGTIAGPAAALGMSAEVAARPVLGELVAAEEMLAGSAVADVEEAAVPVVEAPIAPAPAPPIGRFSLESGPPALDFPLATASAPPPVVATAVAGPIAPAIPTPAPAASLAPGHIVASTHTGAPAATVTPAPTPTAAAPSQAAAPIRPTAPDPLRPQTPAAPAPAPEHAPSATPAPEPPRTPRATPTGARVQPVPSAETTAVPPARSLDLERQWLRRNLAGQYDATAGSVARILSEFPGLRAGGAPTADVLVDLAAVQLYLAGHTRRFDDLVRSAVPGPHVPLARCIASGLGRLPSHRGPALVRAALTERDVRWYGSRQVVTEWAFAPCVTGGRLRLPGSVEVLIWSMTARRTHLVAPERPEQVVFLPGTSFKVLSATVGGEGTGGSEGEEQISRILLRELSASEIGADGRIEPGRVPLDDVALAGLNEAGERWRQEEASEDLPEALRGRFGSPPGLIVAAKDHPEAHPNRPPATPPGGTAS